MAGNGMDKLMDKIGLFRNSLNRVATTTNELVQVPPGLGVQHGWLDMLEHLTASRPHLVIDNVFVQEVENLMLITAGKMYEIGIDDASEDDDDLLDTIMYFSSGHRCNNGGNHRGLRRS